MNIESYLQQAGSWLLSSGLQIALVFVLMAIAMRLSGLLATRLVSFGEKKEDPEFKKRTETLASLIRYILKVLILALGAMIVLKELGVEIGPILAAAGIIGLAVGFGGQHLVQDVISGFFILMEGQIRIGDVVQIADKGGLVERVNLRMTILRDLAGNVHYVRNGQINVVTNMTKDFSRYVFKIGVAYRENIDEVIELIKQIDGDLRQDPEFKDDILEPIEVLGLDQFADSAIIIKARTKTKPQKQWRVGREFNKRLKRRFDELNIEIPFPHITLYMGETKKGESPPLNVVVANHRKEPMGD
jgi:small conductance mechanosensitive channel